MNKDNQYIAVIGDVVESRAIRNRSEIQKDFKSAMNSLNEMFSTDLHARFVVTLGDEFQGLVKRSLNSYQFFQAYHLLFGNRVETRIGFGLGDLSTAMNDEAIGMDGTCFHQARQAVDSMKQKNKFLAFHGFEMNVAINVLANTVVSARQQWTDRQIEVVNLYSQSMDQSQVARELNITKQAVNKVLHAANFNIYYQSWTGINQLFSFSRHQYD